MSGGEEDNCSMKALRASADDGGNLGTLMTISTQRLPSVATSTVLTTAGLVALEEGREREG